MTDFNPPREPFVGGPMDCAQVLLRMYEYLDQELSGEECNCIQTHMDECGNCHQELGVEEEIKLLVNRCHHDVSAPEQLRQRITEQLHTFVVSPFVTETVVSETTVISDSSGVTATTSWSVTRTTDYDI